MDDRVVAWRNTGCHWVENLNRIREEVQAGDLGSLMELVFVPLYGKESGLHRSRLAEEVILFENELYQQGRLSVRLLAATFIMANKMIDEDRLNDLWEAVKMLDILKKAKDEGHKEGMEKGIEKGMEKGFRETLLDLLMENFGTLPVDIYDKIKTISRPDLLQGLFRAALKSKDLHQFKEMLNRVSP